ncbi:MAG: XRE family transcriptional regulator [Planctomycetota bacterium]|nr:MAG: XRE family transcriptional regulator [Planctomycetota bacterium]
MRRAYISGALTQAPNLEELRNFYEKVGEVCRSCGVEPYVPHQHSDPVLNAELSPEEVYSRDKNYVVSSDLLIAYVGVPSLGVGMEIAYADEHNVPIFLLYPCTQTISRMVRGLPKEKMLAEIAFSNEEEALRRLRDSLWKWLKSTRSE